MNNIATIKQIASYNKVIYYSICIEDDGGDSLFELFLKKHTAENKEKLNHIMKWLQLIGEKYGAQEYYFRNEAESSDTRGLPPSGTDREPTYIEDGENVPNNLRLYCFKLNEHVVILYNGDIKTSARAQDCPNVRQHFRLANMLTKLVEEQMNEGIKWNEDYSDIQIEEEFELNW